MTRLFAAIALGLTALPALAAPWVMDKSHAAVTFSVDHLGYSLVKGQFREFDAQIDFDPETVEDTRVRFVIDTESVDTNWTKRDEHLRGGDFFDVGQHPEIVFESTSVTPTGSESAEITGDLTIKGITREVTLDAELNKLAVSPLNDRQTAGFTVTGTIDRTEFDMGYAAPDVGAEVPFRLELEMSPAE